MKFIVHTDGGARENPGPAAVGVVIEMINDKWQMTNEKQKTIEFGKRIGETTNNVAEYTAVREALQYLKTYHVSLRGSGQARITYHEKIVIQFFLDSMLVVNQLNGVFKIKDARLRELFLQVKVLESDIGCAVSYQYVPREQNRRADFLVNKALDSSTSNTSYASYLVSKCFTK